MTLLSESIDYLVEVVKAPSFTAPAVQQAVYRVVQQAALATQQDKEAALQRMSALVSQVKLLGEFSHQVYHLSFNHQSQK